MRGKKAKALRRVARENSPEVKDYRKLMGVKRAHTGSRGSQESLHVVLHPDCMRARYQRIKRHWGRSGDTRGLQMSPFAGDGSRMIRRAFRARNPSDLLS